MSITLKDGTVLPDLPSEYVEEYPYATIFQAKEDGALVLHITRVAVLFFPSEIIGGSGGALMDVSSSHYAYSLDDMNAWGTAFGPLESSLMAFETYADVVWANHDILTVENVTDDGEIVYGEIYFPNSTIFRLPDGTELPALPVGCFEKGAYGVVLKMVDRGVETYILGVATQAGIYVPAEIAGGTYNLIHSAVEGEAYAYVPGTYSDWQHAAAGSLNDPLIEGILELKWSNSDILTATAKNDDGTYEIGTEIYRPSDVNYRIYGGLMQSLANEARRLAGVTGALKPGEMETAFKSAVSAEGLVF